MKRAKQCESYNNKVRPSTIWWVFMLVFKPSSKIEPLRIDLIRAGSKCSHAVYDIECSKVDHQENEREKQPSINMPK